MNLERNQIELKYLFWGTRIDWISRRIKGDIFEYLKRPIRAATRLSPREVVEQMLNQARGVNHFHMNRIRKQQLQHILELTSASVQR